MYSKLGNRAVCLFTALCLGVISDFIYNSCCSLHKHLISRLGKRPLNGNNISHTCAQYHSLLFSYQQSEV
jgi:hypothetical protein